MIKWLCALDRGRVCVRKRRKYRRWGRIIFGGGDGIHASSRGLPLRGKNFTRSNRGDLARGAPGRYSPRFPPPSAPSPTPPPPSPHMFSPPFSQCPLSVAGDHPAHRPTGMVIYPHCPPPPPPPHTHTYTPPRPPAHTQGLDAAAPVWRLGPAGPGSVWWWVGGAVTAWG